ncbi:MAG: cation transport protein [Oscillospiraceae bacterium]|jgi:trk system potassium uptake protein TrkH|nr:cation transport protein [Oscillospiraceae bacterium]
MLAKAKMWMHKVPPVRLIVISFALVILVGACLLTLPVCTKAGHATTFLDALFTAGSATCVTGLVLFDTYLHWTNVGQVIILMLIQVGGLGLVTFTTGMTLLMRKKLGLRNLQLAVENTNGDSSDIGGLLRMIFSFTFACEAIGALLLMIRFVPQMGTHGVWVSIFLSVSAYCNAGFDILGSVMDNGSLIPYVADPLVCLTIGCLIVVGGTGFVVIEDIYRSRLEPLAHHQPRHSLNFHSKIVLLMTVLLVVLGTVVFFVLEYDNTLKPLQNFGTKLNASLLQSISPRTAGFASVDITKEHDFTKLFTVLLMFIGAAPGSTGGGIKTTTALVLVCTVLSVMRGDEEASFNHRRIDKFTIYRALAITCGAMMLVLVVTGIITSTTPNVSGTDALFEATSAFGTVGLTAGVTPRLSIISRIAVIITMYIGRVGPLSLGLAISLKRGHSHADSVFPEGRIIVG